MYIFITVLILIVCVLLAIIVLVQNSKGGGLAANFSAPNQIMGVRKTTDFLEKTTWTLAIVLMVLSITATALIKTKRVSTGTELKSEVTSDAAAPAIPAATTPMPGTEAAAPAADQQAAPAEQAPEAK